MVVGGARVLVAVGNELWATRPLQPELIDQTRDFIQLEHDITLVYANDAGIFVGTAHELLFLAGDKFETLDHRVAAPGLCVLGSAVEINTAELPPDIANAPRGALAIVDRTICLLSGAGEVRSLTDGRYETDATEVHATTRKRDGALQYIAVPA